MWVHTDCLSPQSVWNPTIRVEGFSRRFVMYFFFWKIRTFQSLKETLPLTFFAVLRVCTKCLSFSFFKILAIPRHTLFSSLFDILLWNRQSGIFTRNEHTCSGQHLAFSNSAQINEARNRTSQRQIVDFSTIFVVVLHFPPKDSHFCFCVQLHILNTSVPLPFERGLTIFFGLFIPLSKLKHCPLFWPFFASLPRALRPFCPRRQMPTQWHFKVAHRLSTYDPNIFHCQNNYVHLVRWKDALQLHVQFFWRSGVRDCARRHISKPMYSHWFCKWGNTIVGTSQCPPQILPFDEFPCRGEYSEGEKHFQVFSWYFNSTNTAFTSYFCFPPFLATNHTTVGLLNMLCFKPCQNLTTLFLINVFSQKRGLLHDWQPPRMSCRAAVEHVVDQFPAMERAGVRGWADRAGAIMGMTQSPPQSISTIDLFRFYRCECAAQNNSIDNSCEIPLGWPMLHFPQSRWRSISRFWLNDMLRFRPTFAAAARAWQLHTEQYL